MNLKIKSVFFVVLLFCTSLYAQDEVTIKGTVTSLSDGEPVLGANIVIVGTKKGVSTDFDGNYTLKVKKGDVIQFSYLGFKPKTVTYTNQLRLDVALEENADVLDEIVIVGYGDQKQKNVTSALTKVSGEDLQNQAVSRVEDALKGRVAGLRIQVVSSEAGGDPKITLRGPGSVTGSSSPLIVVDGVILGTDSDILGSIDNNNIESISVLKDASSVAIYGSRGANGVILITLKKGVVGKTTFSYNTFTGYKYADNNENFNTSIADERARLNGLQSTVDGISTSSVNYDRIINDYETAYAELEAMDFIASLGGGERNLQDEVFEGGFIKNHSFSVRGGTELTSYTASLGYLEDQGIAIKDNFNKYNVRIKVDSKSKNKKIKYGGNIRVNYNDQEKLPARFTDPLRQMGHIPLYLNEEHLKYVTQFSTDVGVSTDAGKLFENLGVGSYGFSRAFDHVFTKDPANPRSILRDPNTGLPVASSLTSGGLTLSTTKNVHPLVHFLERSRTKKKLSLNASSYIDFKLAKGLNFRQTVSGVFRHNKTNEADYLYGQENRDQEAYRLERRDELNQFTFESLLKYNREFGKHSLNSVAGFEYMESHNYRQESEAVGYTNDFNDNIALADGGTTYTDNASEKLVSYFGRLDYSYDDKYLFQLSLRSDSSTRFGPNTRTGFFPAASLGWILSNEKFLESNDLISFLKVRASYGVSGSNNISNNIFESLYRFEETYSTISYNGQTGVKGTTLANQILGWEKLIEFNPGLDVTFGRGLVNFTADYYIRTSEDLLLLAPVSATYGTDSWLQNLGEVQNEGVELELTARIMRKDNFRWSASGQFSLNRNTVKSLGNNEQIISRIDQDTRPTEFIAKVGQPITSFYGWVYDREIPLEWVDNPFNRFNNDFADVYVKDLNGDGIIDDDDRTELGSPYPDFEWGFNSDFSIYDFDVSFQFQGSHGAEVRVADLDQLYYASESAVNEVSNFPDRDLTVHRRFTDDHIQDASFVALRNLTVGYTFPEAITDKLNCNKLRLYLTGENLLFFTAKGYEGFNPEAQGQTSNNANTPLTAGYQRGDGPVVKTVSAGINFQF
ncbi:SusC/RagA family TonB-linked outer membrane protein [Polaribacter reichenbachii]|uniref:SusC/RagA family TonB-linked outer membrane protein n=1 Tax=Polaribacter reichenbachii TaxID=996801 RepID=A0A1B8U6G2_9FLAO|nr:SusC/RagA family TonB-linked outer membrane protein [Polaribacter reichenbachii]APZ46127.1 SusC/RagA family TonB-linked outer membrane protein [Polaribacter reichenbachii]AUC19989.1 SusC/RagA family TonB-linked outer membrane protein [Polaribacter reichenbachii]OBY67465.1 SusC/RagA family TonB-linked outer membrane protein [Polaribacter reichenbachii]